MADNEKDTAGSEEAADKNEAATAAGKPTEKAVRAARDDAKKRAEEPNKPVTRNAKEGVGGESFAYLENVPVTVTGDQPSEGALAQAQEDAQRRREDLSAPVVRDANPEVGGESFAYLKHVGR